ncbi:MAG: hypothetical protein AAGN46_16965, partial [Acidobacteriota bacterium]
GELLIRGDTVMSGYWLDPDSAAQSAPTDDPQRAFVRQPAGGGFDNVFFRTGDRVRRLPNGHLTFGGRADHQIKVRGHRVELGEVEAALLRISGVEQAAAFAVPDGEGSSRILAVVVAPRGADDTLKAELRGLLPTHAIPSRVAHLDILPRTPTGKVDRNALRRSALAEESEEATTHG